MLPASLLLLPTILALTTAFSITTYTSQRCTGLSARINLTVSDGCNTFRAGEAQAFIMPWASAADDELLLVTYSDKHCCHADKVAAYGWEDECTAFGPSPGAVVAAWRVVDPNDPDRGKAEEMDSYACRKCGKDACGTVEPGLIPDVPK